MSLICCTQNCVYQHDGYCTLGCTGKSRSLPPMIIVSISRQRVQTQSDQDRQSLADIFDPDELQARQLR